MRKTDYLFVFIVAVLIGIMLRQCQEGNMMIDLHDATQDSLRISVNKNGEQKASISILATTNKKQFLNLQTNDTTIQKLQKVVKDYKGKIHSATVLGTSTADVGITRTITLPGDTVFRGDTIYIYKTYTSDWDEKWSVGSIVANRDSISRKIKIKNDFEFTTGLASQGFLKKDKLEVGILNKNPNTVTTELRTFEIDIPNKRFTVSIQAGYGIVMSGVSISTGPYVGVGVGFTVFKF